MTHTDGPSTDRQEGGPESLWTIPQTARYLAVSEGHLRHLVIEGKFPDYDQIIPKSHSTSIQVYTGEFLRACKRAEIFARDAANTTRVRVNPGESNLVPGQLYVLAQSQEKGDNEGMLDASVDGPGLEVSFNVRYLIDVLNVVSEDQIVIETNGSASPGVIKPMGRKDFIYVVMPMSVTR